MQFRTAAALTLAIVVAACGGGGGGGAAPGGSGATTGTVTSTSPIGDADLAIAASFSPAVVPAGGTTELTITITNRGPGTTRDFDLYGDWGDLVELGDDLRCTATGGATCPAPDAAGLPEIPPKGTLVLRTTARLGATARGDIEVALLAAASNELAPNDNVTSALVIGYLADVSVAGRGPALPVLAGTATSYTMTVTNTGPDAARDVHIVNTLGDSQQGGALACTATGGGTCPAQVGANMTVPVLPSGAALAFTLPVQVASGTTGRISNRMEVTATGDTTPGNNSMTATGAAYAAPASGFTSITLQSDPGDFIGLGRNYGYTPANATLSFTPSGRYLRVQIAGDEKWDATFVMPATFPQFEPATFAHTLGVDASGGGLSWSGEGRACTSWEGTVTINSATYVAGALNAIDLGFEQRCGNVGAALRGHITWVASDTTQPPGPVTPPASLWSPAPGATPASGSYVYLESQAGDLIGRGQTVTYTKATANLAATVSGGHANVKVNAGPVLNGDFVTMDNVPGLVPGLYGDLRRYPFHNPARGGLAWSGDSGTCGSLTGWFVVDGITWSNGSLATLDLRFEQTCDGSTAPLHGKIHWDASDPTVPAGPLNPPPAGLWAPAASALPASGNYIHLDSQPGDWIGQGQTSTLLESTTAIGVFGSSTARVAVTGGGWTGTFQGMDSMTRLEPGYYGNLMRDVVHNPAFGGMEWTGNGRGCNQITGWFVVDTVSYDSSGLASLDLRFEQHCDGSAPALHGKLHWVRP